MTKTKKVNVMEKVCTCKRTKKEKMKKDRTWSTYCRQITKETREAETMDTLQQHIATSVT